MIKNKILYDCVCSAYNNNPIILFYITLEAIICFIQIAYR